MRVDRWGGTGDVTWTAGEGWGCEGGQMGRVGGVRVDRWGGVGV